MATQFEQAAIRGAAYDALSLAFLYPEVRTAASLALKLRYLAAGARSLPWPEVAAAADTAAVALEPGSDADLEEAFLALFGHTVPVDCPPYEGEYQQAHIFQKSQSLADVNAYYAAYGVSPDPALRDRPDHLSMELAFMQFLTLKEAYALAQGHGSEAVARCREGQQGFLSQHLATWISIFVQRLQRKSGPDNPYGALVQFLDIFMEQEWAAFGLKPVRNPTPVAASERG